MATDDSSNPARQSVLELVEILKRLGAHRRAMHEQTYGNPPWTRDQSDAYWYHPLVRACEWLEQRVGISRHDLEDAAFRLSTPQGLRGLDPLTGPGGRTTDAGQPDLLWMFSKFRELDRDGTTARLWQSLVEKYSAILEEAGMPTETQPPAVEPTDPTGGGPELGTAWQDAQAYMEQCRQRGERFTSQDDFAKRLDCSSSTVNKAIHNGTAELQQWACKQGGPTRLNVSPKAAAVALEKTPQSREPDPANAIEQPDVDAAMQFLIEQAKRKHPELGAETESRTQSMDDASRRALAELIYDDPDKAEQAERYQRRARAPQD